MLRNRIRTPEAEKLLLCSGPIDTSTLKRVGVNWHVYARHYGEVTLYFPQYSIEGGRETR